MLKFPLLRHDFPQESRRVRDDEGTAKERAQWAPILSRRLCGNMKKRISYYRDLSADFSRPGLVSADVAQRLIADAERFIKMKEATLPPVGGDYPLADRA